ncbi:MAG: DUF362 domain-containing protein [Proteobacteria bacterium]|nr:DUF362 domain-containing protein [Pseudomonadota bacterium]MBU1688366.1 DUF362 domain-containing protein [Pseudomonadota bacterium]
MEIPCLIQFGHGRHATMGGPVALKRFPHVFNNSMSHYSGGIMDSGYEKRSSQKQLKLSLGRCPTYDVALVKEQIGRLAEAVLLKPSSGSICLIKPNLVTAGGPGFLACSQPEFVAAVAEWCLDHGCRVVIGDSPAFGSARRVMALSGIAEAVKHLDVTLVNFTRPVRVDLPGGQSAAIAREALECDLLLNVPRVKAHSQLYVSLALKNYFGVVVGWRKAMHHARNGEMGNRFEELLVDLPGVLPPGFSIVDGIVAMHREGPMTGTPFQLGLIAVGEDPIAVDTALLEIIGADPERSPLWLECQRREMAGVNRSRIEFPLLKPADLAVEGFELPDHLKPVTFHPGRMALGTLRRLKHYWSDH